MAALVITNDQKAQSMNREQWLASAAKRLEALFVENGYRLPNYVVSDSPSNHSLARLVYQLVIANDIYDPMRATDILAHEMVHAVVGLEHGHGPKFEQCARAIGLEGNPASTRASEVFEHRVRPWLETIGPLPKIVEW